MIPKCMFGKEVETYQRFKSRWVKDWRSPKTILKQRLIIIREQTAIITWPPPSAVFQGRSAGLGDERKQLIIKRGSRPFWFRQQIISNMPEDFVKPKGDWIVETWHCITSLKNWWNANHAPSTPPEHETTICEGLLILATRWHEHRDAALVSSSKSSPRLLSPWCSMIWPRVPGTLTLHKQMLLRFF